MGQIRHAITAAVADSASKEKLEFVTVAVLKVKDSSLVSYTLTDKSGAFTLRNIKDNEPVRLLISYVGYESLRIRLNFTKADVLNLGTLYLKSKNLAEVTIKGEITPIIIKKDTIEFNAEAFKVRPNAVVQDLLKKLPGMQVDHDGTMTFNGKDISKIKIDGKDFFANDPKIASQNLDADMISKVQVYDDRENDPDHLEPDYKVKKIINLKFKKEFVKSTFGNIAAAGGTQDRYKINGLFSKSVNDLQVSVIGNSNNLTGTDFIGSSGGFSPSNGLRQSTTAQANINDNFGKTVKVNLVYSLNSQVNDNHSAHNTAQFLNDTTLTTNSANISHSVSTSHGINGTVEWSPDAATKIRYLPQFTYTTNSGYNSSNSISYNNFTPILNQSISSGNNTGNSTRYQHSLSYYKSLKTKGESITITNDVQSSPNSSAGYSASQLISYVAGLNSDTLNRLTNNSGKSTNVDLIAVYQYPLTKTITSNISVNETYSSNGADLFTYDLDPKTGLYNIFLQSQSSQLTRNQSIQSAHPNLIYRKKNIMLTLGFILQTQQIDNQFNNNLADLNQHFTYLFPSINLGINKVTINYSEDVQQPAISDMQPITIVYNQLNSFMGNPNLKPTRHHVFSIFYFNFNTQSMLNSNLSFRILQDGNSITRDRLVTAQGATLTTPINGKGRFSMYLNGSIDKRFKKEGKWQIRENARFDSGYGHNYYLVDHVPGFQDTYYCTATEGLFVNWNDVVDIEPSYSISPSLTKYELVKLPNASYIKQQVNVPLNVQWPKRIIWDINYSYIYNPLVATGFQRSSNLLGVSIARTLQQKDKGELRLTCYDLLNQSVSALHFASDNTINDIQNQSIKRYFLLSYTYRFNKVTTKEKH